MTVEEYQAAQLWTVAEASKNETGGGDGIEVLTNEPFSETDHKPEIPLVAGGTTYTTGQYTSKIYHLASKVPKFIRMLSKPETLNVQEYAWNAFPYCRTVLKNKDFMKENFTLKIETMHVQDKVDIENIHQLSKEQLEQREVIYIDIANAEVSSSDYKAEWDPKLYQSKKTGRGPLVGETWWQNTDLPIMCAYKLVTCEFVWFGFQILTESFMQSMEKRIFTNFHRQLFCETDSWYGLSMDDVRALEDKTKQDLDKQRFEGELRGTTADD